MTKRNRVRHRVATRVESHSDNPTKLQVYRAAKAYVASGLSLIPIRADGSKMPAFELLPREWDEDERRHKRIWRCFKERCPTRAELRAWFRDSDEEYGMSILGGAISGGLEIIDCDSWDVAERWMKLVKKKAPGLLDRLVLVRSPRPGLHAYFRCAEFGGNEKLARIPDPEDKRKPKAIIEIKGEAGYCLAPPSPGACHKTGRCYQFIGDNDLTKIPTIKPEERAILIACARQLDRWTEPERPSYAPRPRLDVPGRLDRPGDDFNARADWGEILIPHGWTWVRGCGKSSDQWRRPGKSRGISATTNYAGTDRLWVFSASAHPFDESHGYTKFHAYALLNHEGDFSAAARALSRLGYGLGRPQGRRRKADPFARYAGYSTRSSRRPR